MKHMAWCFTWARPSSRWMGSSSRCADGSALQADLIVAGVGVRPRLALAEQAGLAIDRGVSVDEFLQSSVPGIYAAGDIARWPDVHTGQRIRVEHWALAQRQGQVAALNMLGHRQRFDAVPFFWSQHHDVAIQYVGHAEQWDRIDIDGAPDARDCSVRYILAGKILATVTIGRDRESLSAERALESAGAGIVERPSPRPMPFRVTPRPPPVSGAAGDAGGLPPTVSKPSATPCAAWCPARVTHTGRPASMRRRQRRHAVLRLLGATSSCR